MTDGRLQETITTLAQASADDGGSAGLRVFAQLHGQALELIVERIRTGFFDDPDFVELLAVHTTKHLLDAMYQSADGEQVPPAWRPLVSGSRHAGVHPVQFALAGVNAQLHHDAPVALVSACKDANLSPYRPELEEDFGRCCALLVEFVDPLRDAAINQHSGRHGSVRPAFPRPAQAPLAGLIKQFAITRARLAAWVNGLTLWQINSIESLAQQFETTLAHTTGLIGGQLMIGFIDQLEVTQPLTEEMLFGP